LPAKRIEDIKATIAERGKEKGLVAVLEVRRI